MTDAECVTFLQWALPRLQMRWPGFRRVRRQVRRRINKRIDELSLPDVDAYRAFLEDHPDEWQVLDGMCRITISRFYRNRSVFAFVFDVVLPRLAASAHERGSDAVRVWSIGCASGEEPYTVAIGSSGTPIEVVATDADAHMLERARAATYDRGSLRQLPEAWLDAAFDVTPKGTYRLRRQYSNDVRFLQQDVRREAPDGPFDLVLCRNLVFTYFEEPLQRRVLGTIASRMVSGGALVLGHHETVPDGRLGFARWNASQPVFRYDPIG